MPAPAAPDAAAAIAALQDALVLATLEHEAKCMHMSNDEDMSTLIQELQQPLQNWALHKVVLCSACVLPQA
jgi:hypothetical protein